MGCPFKTSVPYTIGTERGLNRKIIIEERWKNFLVDNMVSIEQRREFAPV